MIVHSGVVIPCTSSAAKRAACVQVVAVHDTNLYYYPQPDGTVVSRAHQARD